MEPTVTQDQTGQNEPTSGPMPGEVREQERSAPGEPRSDFVMERFGRLQDADRSFDIEYWQQQGDAAIFEAAWELAEFYHRAQGMDADELRLQRSVENIQRA